MISKRRSSGRFRFFLPVDGKITCGDLSLTLRNPNSVLGCHLVKRDELEKKVRLIGGWGRGWIHLRLQTLGGGFSHDIIETR